MDKKSVKINAEKIWYTLNEVKSVSHFCIYNRLLLNIL